MKKILCLFLSLILVMSTLSVSVLAAEVDDPYTTPVDTYVFDFESTGLNVGDSLTGSTDIKKGTTVVGTVSFPSSKLYLDEDNNYSMQFASGSKFTIRNQYSDTGLNDAIYLKFRFKANEQFVTESSSGEAYFGFGYQDNGGIWKMLHDESMVVLGKTVPFNYDTSDWMTVECMIDCTTTVTTVILTQGDNRYSATDIYRPFIHAGFYDRVYRWSKVKADAANNLDSGAIYRLDIHKVQPNNSGVGANLLIDDLTYGRVQCSDIMIHTMGDLKGKNNQPVDSEMFSYENAVVTYDTENRLAYPSGYNIEIAQEADTASVVTHNLKEDVYGRPFGYFARYNEMFGKNSDGIEQLTGDLKIYAVTTDGETTEDILLATHSVDEQMWIGEDDTVKKPIAYEYNNYGNVDFSVVFDPATKKADVMFGTTNAHLTRIDGTVSYNLPNVIGIKYVSTSPEDEAQKYYLHAIGYHRVDIFRFDAKSTTNGYVDKAEQMYLKFMGKLSDIGVINVTEDGVPVDFDAVLEDENTIKVSFAQGYNKKYVVTVDDALDVYGNVASGTTEFTPVPYNVDMPSIKKSADGLTVTAETTAIENDGEGRTFHLALLKFDSKTHMLTDSSIVPFAVPQGDEGVITTGSLDFDENSYYEAFAWENMGSLESRSPKKAYGIEPFAGIEADEEMGFAQDFTTGDVKVSGYGIDEDSATVMILNPGYTLDDVDAIFAEDFDGSYTFEDAVVYIKQFDYTETSNEIEKDLDAFAFRPLNMGSYGFAIKVGDRPLSWNPNKFNYYPLDVVFGDINSDDEFDVSAVVAKYDEFLTVDDIDKAEPVTVFTEEEKAEVNAMFIEKRNALTADEVTGYRIDTIADFETLYKEVVGRNLAKIGYMETAFEKYGDAMGMGEYASNIKAEGEDESVFESYIASDADAKAKFYELMSAEEGIVDPDELEELFNYAVVLVGIEFAENQITVEDIIENCNSFLEFNLNNYNNLDKKSDVNKELVGKVFEGETVAEKIADLKEEFYDLVSEVEEEEDSKKKPTKKPSGGGGGGGYNISTPTTPATTTSKTFGDMSDHGWAAKAVDYLSKKNIIAGKGNGNFAPNDDITREEFIKIVVSAFASTSADAKCDFTDVAFDAWYYPFVASAYDLGIVNGQLDGGFGIGQRITRQDMAVMLSRAAKQTGISLNVGALSFADKDSIADYAKDAVAAMSASGIINGVGDNSFAPEVYATRAQAAKMVYEMLVKGGKIQ